MSFSFECQTVALFETAMARTGYRLKSPSAYEGDPQGLSPAVRGLAAGPLVFRTAKAPWRKVGLMEFRLLNLRLKWYCLPR